MTSSDTLNETKATSNQFHHIQHNGHTAVLLLHNHVGLNGV